MRYGVLWNESGSPVTPVGGQHWHAAAAETEAEVDWPPGVAAPDASPEIIPGVFATSDVFVGAA